MRHVVPSAGTVLAAAFLAAWAARRALPAATTVLHAEVGPGSYLWAPLLAGSSP